MRIDSINLIIDIKDDQIESPACFLTEQLQVFLWKRLDHTFYGKGMAVWLRLKITLSLPM